MHFNGKSPRVSHRARGRHASAVPPSLAAVFAILLPLPEAPLPLALAIVGAVVALAAFWAPVFALLGDAGDSVGLDLGYAFSLTTLAWAGGQVWGAAAGGWLAEHTADEVPYTALAVLCSASLVALARYARPEPLRS